jgi:hypothetical protein
MTTRGSFATAILAVAVLLSGCAPSSVTTAHSAAPSPTATQPAFLTSAQGDIDRVPDDIAQSMHIEPESTRYQGSWDGRQVFLAVKRAGSVCLVMTTAKDPNKWTAACGDRGGVVTDELPDGTTAKYLPMVTQAAPEGWTRLSDYVFVM